MNTDVRNIWENCLSFIKDNVTTDVYDVWFKPIEPVELTSDNTLVIMVPSMFFMEWIEDHYINLIWSALTKELGARPKLIYNIKMENNPNKTEQATEQLPSSNRKATSMEVLGYKQKPQQSYNPYVVPGLVEIEEVKVDSQLILIRTLIRSLREKATDWHALLERLSQKDLEVLPSTLYLYLVG